MWLHRRKLVLGSHMLMEEDSPFSLLGMGSGEPRETMLTAELCFPYQNSVWSCPFLFLEEKEG